MDISVTASVVAWYAAIVSTASLIVSGYVAWRDRARLKITAGPNFITIGNIPPYDRNRLYVSITIANMGRRPATVSAVGMLLRKKGSGELLVGESIQGGPREVAEGKSTTYMVDQKDLPLAEIRAVIVRDQAGRLWKERVRWKPKSESESTPG